MNKSLLNVILNGSDDDILIEESINKISVNAKNVCMEQDASIDNAVTGYCVECEDQPSEMYCENCQDDYCSVCFNAQHRKGKRKKHSVKKFCVQAPTNPTTKFESSQDSTTEEETEQESNESPLVQTPVSKGNVGDWFKERSKYIPMRLSLNERKYLRLLEAALHVSEYTDKIDIITYTSKSKRIVAQIKELCSILSGLTLAADYKGLLRKMAIFTRKCKFSPLKPAKTRFELGRRHKIMNPEKMRGTYGKLIYMLMDSQIPEVKEMLGFDCVSEIKTVYSVLEALDGLAILQDEYIVPATMEIIASKKTRTQVQNEIKQKEKAIEYLARKYSTMQITSDTIKQCLYSIGDNHAFLRTNRDPCDSMIGHLKRHFNAESFESGYSLAIQSGREGARLSHNHEKQYNYVLQSLSLWREIQHEMFQLWYSAEQDLLQEDNYYRLRDTGQGLNRVQAAPRVSRMMHTILHRAQQRLGYWVGSSVIHLGDHNVPNSLMFIDKYTQIYRFLLPICTTIEQLQVLSKDSKIAAYIDSTFGGIEKAKKLILSDFFRHAFDGSGADNYFDAGSCIDGRLTSAWNWCSQMEKKPYFSLFLLSGFVGFDGQF